MPICDMDGSPMKTEYTVVVLAILVPPLGKFSLCEADLPAFSFCSEQLLGASSNGPNELVWIVEIELPLRVDHCLAAE